MREQSRWVLHTGKIQPRSQKRRPVAVEPLAGLQHYKIKVRRLTILLDGSE